jgi:hypothetical protein
MSGLVIVHPAAGRRVRACLAALGLVVLAAPPAAAFRTIEDYPEVPDGARVRWPDGVFEFWTYDHGIDSIDASRLAEVSTRALFAWAEPSCARLRPRNLGITSFHAESGDGMNTIEIIDGDWEGLGFPSDAAGANDVLFQEEADGTWTIVEADIYINAANFRFTTATTPESDERSLLGVLTHEAGHALGLLHSCEPDGADDAPICDADDPPGDLMYPYHQPDQVYPEAEDEAGLCYLYPSCELEGCADGLRCQDGECVPPDSGDDEHCEKGNGEAGARSDDACAPKRPSGGECSESNQCEGGECVAGVTSVPVCTQRCGEGKPACPQSWTCSVVEERSVCLPPRRDPGCEYALRNAPRAPHGSRTSHEFFAAAGVGLMALLRARTRIFRLSRSTRR